MYPENFAYFRPKTLAEASALLKKNKGARILAGGHSLLPAMKFRLATPKALVDIGGIKSLAGIAARGKSIAVGAMTVHADVASSPLLKKSCPLLPETAAQIGDLQVRNRGTIGGSIAHADPAADYPTALVALGATVVARGPKGERKIPAEEFFVDLFTTALKPGEIIVSVLVPTFGKGDGASYMKHPHPASRYAVAAAAAIVGITNGVCSRASLVIGGVSAMPVRVLRAQAALVGKKPDAAAVESAAAQVAALVPDPMADAYASGEFRIHLASVLAKRALTAAIERARG